MSIAPVSQTGEAAADARPQEGGGDLTPATEVEPPCVPQIEVCCAGSPQEMGRTQGEALREKIHLAMNLLTRLEAFRLRKPRWVPVSIFRQVAERKALRFIAEALPETLPDMQARLEGIATAAEVSVQGLFLLNVMEAVLADLRESSAVPLAPACSAVAVTGRASKDGQPILAHNFDYLREVRPLYTLRECRPAGRLHSLEFTAAPLGGCVDGVNEAGLAITYNYAFTQDTGRPRPTISMWISEALSTCRTVSEAAALIASSPRSGGGLLMLGDAEGEIASLELASTRSAVRSARADDDRLFHTNRFSMPGMKEVEVDETAMYTHRAPRALRNRRVHQSSDRRNALLNEHFITRESFDLAGLEEVMSHHGPDGMPSSDTVCMHSDYWHTTACIRLLPRERRMRVAYDSACRAEFVDFQL